MFINDLKYWSSLLFGSPLLPFMFWQGTRIRKNTPTLPEAMDTIGVSQMIKSSKELNICFLGESSVAGVGIKSHYEGLVGTISNFLSKTYNRTVSWDVIARSGYTTKRVEEKLLKKVPNKNYDLMIIGLGGNNAFNLQSPAKWTRDIRSLILGVKKDSKDVPIVFLTSYSRFSCI